MPTRKSRFAGCLVGQCLGDALGFPVEGYVPDVCRQYVSGILRSGRAGEVGRPPFPFGQYTDDSQLARELLQSYRAVAGFDPGDFASRIAALFAEGRVVGEGRATAAAAARLAAGTPWNKAGEPGPSAGNGSAMRAGPVGLLFRSEPEELVRVASEQGRITHGDPRCSAGAVSVAGAVALAMQEGPIATEEFLHTLAEWSAPVDASMTEALESLKTWIHLPPAESHRSIAGAGLDGTAANGAGEKGITPFVVGSVLWSLYAFLRSPDDYWETICLAVSGGGDTDTTAAMAGAMSGARVGLGGLPPLLTMKLTDRGSWGYDELVGLAEECCELAEGMGN
jgi:ADP-ribosylglycohydrolase